MIVWYSLTLGTSGPKAIILSRTWNMERLTYKRLLAVISKPVVLHSMLGYKMDLVALTEERAMATTDRSGVAELSLKRVLVFVTIFVVSFGVAYLFVERIQLPFSNPHGIVGTLSAIKYNPSTNILRFLFVVLLPSFSLIVAYLSMPALLAAQLFPTLTSNPKTDHVQSTRTLAGRLFYPSVVAVTLLTALNMESYMAAGAFETYEEGQPLS